MDRRINIGSKDPGAKDTGSASGDPSAKNELNPVRAPQVEVVSNSFLEELASGKGTIEHLGETDLELEDGEVMVIACPSVFVSEGLWQLGHPASEEGLHMSGIKLVADLLDSRSIGSAKDAVIQAGKWDILLLELALDPLVTIEPDPSSEGGIGTQLDKARAKVAVQDIKVIMVDTDTSAGELIVGDACWASIGTRASKGGGLFLGNADKHNSFSTRCPLEIWLSYFLLALAFSQLDYGDISFPGKALHGSHKGSGNLTQERW